MERCAIARRAVWRTSHPCPRDLLSLRRGALPPDGESTFGQLLVGLGPDGRISRTGYNDTCRRSAGAGGDPAPLRGGGIKPTAQSIRGNRRDSLGYFGSEEPWDRETPAISLCSFASSVEGGGTAGTRRAGVPRFRRPPYGGLGKEKEGGRLAPRTHGSQGIAVGFIPSPHTGLGHLLDCGGCLQMCYCTLPDGNP